MKTKLLLFLCAALLLSCLGGCAQGGTVNHEETLDFDLDTAAAMIDEAEWLTTWLQAQDHISLDEADALIVRLNGTLNGTLNGNDGENIVAAALTDVMDYALWKSGALRTIPVGNTYISPTVYYEGVSVTSATVESLIELSEETGSEVRYSDVLRIRKEYAGDAAELRG